MSEHKPYLAFGNDWFKKYQIILIVLLHFPVIGNILRYILGIKTLLPIIKITGSNYVIFKGLTKRQLIAYSGLVFSMAIYKAFKPFWWSLHYIDEFLAFCKVPERFSFGFSTLTAYSQAGTHSPCDGWTNRRYTSGESFASLITGAANYFGTITQYGYGGVYYMLKATTTTDMYREIYRAFILFDTNIGSGATISKATILLYLLDKGNTGLNKPYPVIVSSNPASTSSIATTDHNSLGSTRLAADIAFDSIASGYNHYVLNNDGWNNINKSGISKFGWKAIYDFNGSCTWVSGQSGGVAFYWADTNGTNYAPKIEVEYSTSAIKNHIGTAAASIKKHIGTAAADIKKHIGTT